MLGVCKNCRFYTLGGNCHRHAPEILSCGDFEPAPGPQDALVRRLYDAYTADLQRASMRQLLRDNLARLSDDQIEAATTLLNNKQMVGVQFFASGFQPVVRDLRDL